MSVARRAVMNFRATLSTGSANDSMEKNQILDEINRTAVANGGVPLGWRRFEEETGIKYYDWCTATRPVRKRQPRGRRSVLQASSGISCAAAVDSIRTRSIAVGAGRRTPSGERYPHNFLERAAEGGL